MYIFKGCFVKMRLSYLLNHKSSLPKKGLVIYQLEMNAN